MEVTRRGFVGLGAGAAGAFVGTMTTSGPAAADKARLDGIHIYALLNGVSPPGFTGFPYSVMFALWGPDHALNGMGWGATTEGGDPVLTYVGGSVFPCVFAARGSVEGDLVKVDAVQILTGTLVDQGLPWRVEANLATGAVKGIEVNAGMGTEFVLDGTGVVTRI